MPSAHLSARPRPISRSQGESATAAASYRARCVLVDERTGQVHDYSPKADDVLFSGMYAPKNAPEWANDRAGFWNRVEAREHRKDSQLAREFTIALPHELTPEQNRRLVQDFVRENFVRKGYVVDVNIHKPHSWGDQRNVHAHILIPLRKFDGPEWSKDKDHFKDCNPDIAELIRLREKWEQKHNEAMNRYGHEGRIDMRTLAEQGIDRTPEIHLGKGAAALQRQGIETERSERLNQIRADNLARQKANDNEPTKVHDQSSGGVAPTQSAAVLKTEPKPVKDRAAEPLRLDPRAETRRPVDAEQIPPAFSTPKPDPYQAIAAAATTWAKDQVAKVRDAWAYLTTPRTPPIDPSPVSRPPSPPPQPAYREQVYIRLPSSIPQPLREPSPPPQPKQREQVRIRPPAEPTMEQPSPASRPPSPPPQPATRERVDVRPAAAKPAVPPPSPSPYQAMMDELLKKHDQNLRDDLRKAAGSRQHENDRTRRRDRDHDHGR